MQGLSPEEQWRMVSPHLDVALPLDESSREEYLVSLCATDPALAAELRSLLAEQRYLADFLDGGVAFPGADQPADIGPYRVLRTLGEGGMGIVYLAQQTDPVKRQLAIKVIRLMGGKRLMARFAYERQALAMMEHPNIARLYDAGVTAEGHPYFAMEYVPGEPATAYCDLKRLSCRDRLRIFQQVCAAMQHAHQKGVIHRDLKPSNILVAEQDGVPLPKVIDFGVAKAVNAGTDGRTSQTEAGARIGTPRYMSPEQESGGDVDSTSDIYSLGVVLYELLAGKTPAEQPVRRLDITGGDDWVAKNRGFASVGALRQILKGDLESITLKALNPEKGQRYASASEFAADIERYLQDQPVLARAPGTMYRLHKFLQRHRIATALAVFATLALMSATIVAFRQAAHARERFDQLRKIARIFIYDFHEELQRVPGNTKATALLISTASEYLDKLALSAGNDRGLLLELAQAYEQLATIQGGSSINLNQRLAALDNRRRAAEIRLQAAGTNLQENVRLISAAGRIANDLKDLGRLEEAVAAGRRAVAMSQLLLKDPPPEVRPDIALVHVYLARALRKQGNLLEASAELDKAETLLAGSSGDSAPRLRLLERWDRAALSAQLGLVQEAVTLLESIERDVPSVAAALPAGRAREATLRLLPVTWGLLANIYGDRTSPSLGDSNRSLEYNAKVCRQWSEHLKQDSSDRHARSQFAVCQLQAAAMRSNLNPAQAVLEARRGLEVLRSSGGMDDAYIVSNLAHGETALALALHAAGRTAEGYSSANSAAGKFRSLAAAERNNPELTISLIWALVTQAQLGRALEKQDEARRAASEAARLSESLAASLDLRARLSAAQAYRVNAEVAARTDQCGWQRKELAVWQNWNANRSAWVARQGQEAEKRLSSCIE